MHPYDNFNVICGQGTASLELLEERKGDLDAVIAPVGGGGLMSGTSTCVKGLTTKQKFSEPLKMPMMHGNLSIQGYLHHLLIH